MERSASSLLSWLLVPVAAMLVASAVSLPQLPYTGLVMHGAEVITVLPDGPGARAGAHEGDRVLWVFDGDGRHDADRLLTGASPGRPLTLLVARGAARRSLWLVPATLPDGDRRMDAMLLLVASGFVLIGGWVWSERRDPLTRAFFLMCIGFAWLLPQTPPWGPRLAAALYRVAQSAATVYLPSLFIHFFALFPDRHPRGGLSAVVRLGYVVGTGLFAASLVVLIGHQVEVPLGPLEAALQTAAALWFAAGVLVAFVLFAAPFARAGSGDARRRLRVAFAGTLLGAGPLAAFILIRNTAPSVPLPGERAVVLLTLLVPASFAWATVVHAVFDFRVALRIGAVTLLLAGFGAALYAFGEWLAATWWPHLGAGIAGGALALVALGACVAGPLAPWMRSLGSRVLPEIEPTSLAAWVAREPDLRELSMERMLHEACAAMQRYLRIDGCALVTFDPQEARAVAGVGTLGGTVAATVPALDLEPVRTAGVCALDESDLAPPARQAFERAGVRWLLPVGGDPLRGLALLGRRLAGSWLGRHEVFELERFAERLAITLENAELKRAAHGRDHIDRELREAGEIQARLLPRRAPVYPTLDCAAAALSSGSVGGDYYDFVEGPARDFTLAVGDAAGKGVPAALVLAGVQARFRSEARKGLTPGQVLEGLNRELVGLDQPEKFVGLLCARFEVRTGRLWFANAGLTPPIVRRRGGQFEELLSGGLLLGVSHGASYPDETVTLGAGDLVVIYTDGLTEARRGDELFGVDRVREVLDRLATRRASDILEGLLAGVRAFADRTLDDVTVVVLRQLTEPMPARVPAAQNSLKWSWRAVETNG